MEQLTLAAPAKLNLFLTILGRRSDGYHELQTLFQLLDFGDELTFEVADSTSVSCPAIGGEPGDNLIYRAAEYLKIDSGSDRGAAITVEKRIPVGAGLGGGSSDAATTLVALNELWQLDYSTGQLAELGRSLGADVPVFVHGRTAFAEGVGEVLQPVDLPIKDYVVVFPGVSVSTARIFSHPDLTRTGSAITIARFLQEGAPPNACETLVRRLYPEVDEAIRWLAKWGPARMTGTGASVFLEVPSGHLADEIVAAVPPEWSAFKAQGINESPLARR